MTATSGDWLKRVVPATMFALLAALSACSGGESEPAQNKATTTTAEPTVDQAAADRQALVKLAATIWSVRQQAYNSGEASDELFAGVYTPAATEVELGRISSYRGQKIVRTGAPVITDVETSVSGDAGKILLCLDEDGWGAHGDGTPIKVKPRGPKPWGAAVERSADGWLFVEAMQAADVEKEKTC